MSREEKIKDRTNHFLSAWSDAVEARQKLEWTHNEKFWIVETYIKEVEKHSEVNKRRQTHLSAFQVCAAVAACVEPVTATVLIGGGLAKWHSNRISRRNMKTNFDEAVAVIEDERRAMNEFIEAAKQANQAREALCQNCPQLKKMKINYLALTATYPGFIESIAANVVPDAATSAALYMIEEYPETSWNILLGAIDIGIDSIGVVGVENVLDASGIVFEAVPFVGVAINLEKLRRARNDQHRATTEAETLRCEYEKSMSDYESICKLMKEFHPISH